MAFAFQRIYFAGAPHTQQQQSKLFTVRCNEAYTTIHYFDRSTLHDFHIPRNSENEISSPIPMHFGWERDGSMYIVHLSINALIFVLVRALSFLTSSSICRLSDICTDFSREWRMKLRMHLSLWSSKGNSFLNKIPRVLTTDIGRSQRWNLCSETKKKMNMKNASGHIRGQRRIG